MKAFVRVALACSLGACAHAGAVVEEEEDLKEFGPPPASQVNRYQDEASDSSDAATAAQADEPVDDGEASGALEESETAPARDAPGREYAALGAASEDPLGGLSDSEVLGKSAAPAAAPEAVAEAPSEPDASAPGALTVRAKGKKSKKPCVVSVNGTRFGKVPVINAELEPGRHHVIVKCKNKKRYDDFVEVESGHEEVVTFNLAGKGKRGKRHGR